MRIADIYKRFDSAVGRRPDVASFALLICGFVVGVAFPFSSVQSTVRALFFAAFMGAWIGRSWQGVSEPVSRRCLIVLAMSLAAYIGLAFVDG